MTAFKAPFSVVRESNPPVSTDPVTAAHVSATGWNIRDNLRVSGAATLANNATVSGALLNGARGDRVVITQAVTVNEGNTAAVTAATMYPGGSLVDVLLNQRNAAGFGTAAATVNVLVGDTSSDARFGTFTNVSGRTMGMRANGTTPTFLLATDITTKRNIVVKTTAVSGATSGGVGGAAGAGQAILNIVYTR